MKLAFLLLAVLSPQAGYDEYVRLQEKKTLKFQKTLETKPDDPEANEAVGKFLCFVKSDWERGLPHLAKSKDQKLRDTAGYEMGSLELPKEKDSPLTGATFDFGEEAAPELIKGDNWWELTKKYKDVEFRSIMNRALWRYRQALSKVDEARKKKLLDRISKVMERFRSVHIRPGGKVTEGPPRGWGIVLQKGEKQEGVALDESRSNTGRSSFRVQPARAGLLVTERRAMAPNQELILSFWYMAEGTVVEDLLSVWFIKKDDTTSKAIGAPMPPDKGELPMWTRVEMKVTSPQDAMYFRLHINNPGMREGTLWLDDISFRYVNKPEELIDNPGFEER
jgi:hypothetical protein